MAKLKIYQSQLGVKSPTVPQVGALALPFSLATQTGVGFSKLGKALEDIRDKRQETQDRNDAIKIEREIDLDIAEKFNSHQRSSDIADVTTFYNTTDINNYQSNFNSHKANKRVKELVGKYLFTEQKDFGQRLIGKITLNHHKETRATHEEELNKITFRMASSDKYTSGMGYRELESWFKNTTNTEKYEPKELEQLKKEKELQAEKYFWMFGAKNNPDFTIKNHDLIEEKIGKKESEAAVEIAKQKIASDADFSIKKEKFDERFKQDEKIATFTELLLRIKNDDDPEFLGKVPTLDLLNDLWKANKINSAQYDALLKFYDNSEDYGNEEVLRLINSQIFIAESVEDLDRIHRTLNLTPEYLMELGVKDITTMNSVIAKAKDRQIFQDMKHYKNILDDILGKLDNGIFVGLGSSNVSSDKKLRTKAERLYNEYIEDGLSPEESFMRVSKGYLLQQNRMPTIYDVSQITSIQTLEPSADEKKTINPEEKFNNWRKKVALKYKDGTINIAEMKRDLDSLDVMEDLFKIRQTYQKVNKGFDAWGSSNATIEGDTGK